MTNIKIDCFYYFLDYHILKELSDLLEKIDDNDQTTRDTINDAITSIERVLVDFTYNIKNDTNYRINKSTRELFETVMILNNIKDHLHIKIINDLISSIKTTAHILNYIP